MRAADRQLTFEQSLRQAQAALRAGRAATAERWLRALVAQAPDEPTCQWLIGAALLAQGQLVPAIAALEAVLSVQPEFAAARVDLARAYRGAARLDEARREVRRVLEAQPGHALAWLAYGDVLVDLKQYTDARIAYERARRCDPHRARIEEASAAFLAGDRQKPEEIFRSILQNDPSHVAALCGLAALSHAASIPKDAERLLRHALTQSAHLPLAWRGLAPVLQDLGRLLEADAAARHLLAIEPDNAQNWVVLGSISIRLMRQDEALRAYLEAQRLNPQEVRLQMSLGHLHKTAGRRSESEQAYKASLQLDPGHAEAYWSLADLKNYTFSEAEVAAMRALLAATGRERSSEAQLHFALGRALEQRHEYPEAFSHYARGNALRRLDSPFDIGRFEAKTARVRRYFDQAFFAARAGAGCDDPAPIFIVGLPRSGSTLVEQILASHSQVDGTMELQNILTIVREFDRRDANWDAYPESLREVSAQQLRGLGQRFLGETAPLRSGRAHFIDKMPNNFSHVGLIHVLLPRATVIDVRRHPLDACFSTFRQYFAEGQSFSYDLEDLGRYYRCYLQLMDHWDEVLPGKVLHVSYEALVRDPENCVRRLLAHCQLPFESACLSFHQNPRAVRTASAEQVRQPIYQSAVGYWRHFARELEPLRHALGDVLARFEAPHAASAVERPFD
jgi:cytochrome c-type biogenesis protein CcmH/NrfG